MLPTQNIIKLKLNMLINSLFISIYYVVSKILLILLQIDLLGGKVASIAIAMGNYKNIYVEFIYIYINWI